MRSEAQNRLNDAYLYAAGLHAGQERKKTGRPYIGHLMGVCALVMQYGGDEEQAIAALLHDAVEDQGGRPRLEEIRAKFGERVARIVEGCTDSFEVDATQKLPWDQRKRDYLARVLHEPADVLLVSAADKLYNVREILLDYRAHGESVWERSSGKRNGTLWYYRALLGAYRSAALPPQTQQLVDELDSAVTELERLAGASARAD